MPVITIAAGRIGPAIPPEMVGTIILEGWAVGITIALLLYAAAREWRRGTEGDGEE